MVPPFAWTDRELPREPAGQSLLRVIQHNELSAWARPIHQSRCADHSDDNRDLEEEVRKGGFGRTFTIGSTASRITVPPLRQRKEDIPLMVQAFHRAVFQEIGKQITSIRRRPLKVLPGLPVAGERSGAENIIERWL